MRSVIHIYYHVLHPLIGDSSILSTWGRVWILRLIVTGLTKLTNNPTYGIAKTKHPTAATNFVLPPPRPDFSVGDGNAIFGDLNS